MNLNVKNTTIGGAIGSVLGVLLAFCMVPSAHADTKWTTRTATDEMDGKRWAVAYSPLASPNRELAFPYNGLQAALRIQCSEKDSMLGADVFFTVAPNLSNTETKDGYSVSRHRIKFDAGEVRTERFTQRWGSQNLAFANDLGSGPLVRNIKKHNRAKFEVSDWHGVGSFIFDFSLAGATAAIQEVQAWCKLD